MSKDNVIVSINRKSKDIIAVNIQSDNRAISSGLQLLCDRAAIILDMSVPTKWIRKSLLDTAQSLLELQSNIVQEIPNLIPDKYSQYLLKRTSRVKAHD